MIDDTIVKTSFVPILLAFIALSYIPSRLLCSAAKLHHFKEKQHRHGGRGEELVPRGQLANTHSYLIMRDQ